MPHWRSHVGCSSRQAGVLFSLGVGLTMGVVSAGAQVPRESTVVVGDLTGRWEPDRFLIPTSRGEFPAFETDGLVDSGAPFLVSANSEHEFLIRFRTDNDLPHPPAVSYRIFPSERRLISALILDEVDFAELEREESAVEVHKSNPMILRIPQRLPSNTVTLVIYNHRLPLFQNRKVRVAIGHAINRRQIIHEVLDDKATAARGPLDDTSWAYPPGLTDQKYDPRLSVRLLSEAGWVDHDGDRVLDKDGQRLEFTLTYPENLLLQEQLVRKIRLSLSEIGIHVRQIGKPMVKLRADLASGDFEATLIQVRFQESGESFREYFGNGGENNYGRFRSATVDRYLQLYDQSTNKDTRKKLLQALQVTLNREQPVTFLYFKWWTHFLMNSRRLEDVRDGRGGILPYDQWKVKPKSLPNEP